MADMETRVSEGTAPPLTFHNAPTVEIEGKLYLTDAAAEELGDRVAARYSTLLERLAAE